jgi:hypothetical protein
MSFQVMKQRSVETPGKPGKQQKQNENAFLKRLRPQDCSGIVAIIQAH